VRGLHRLFDTTVLAALLHDIGKAVQRGDYGAIKVYGRHPKHSLDFVRATEGMYSRFVDEAILQDLVYKHHEGYQYAEEMRPSSAQGLTEKLAYIVSRADNYSSSERGVTESRPFRSVPLYSVFASLSLGSQNTDVYTYNLGEATDEDMFPMKGEIPLDNEGLARIMRSLAVEVRNTLMCASSSRELIPLLLSLFQKHLWSIPANSQEKTPDVSLYDHLKTTAAIAGALYRYHEYYDGLNDLESIKEDERKKFLLLAGDLSGIQRYIFSIANVGAGGTAKRLRARSLFLQMLVQVVALDILDRCKLTSANQVIAAGGRFHLLLPNTSEVVDIIAQVKDELETELLDRYKATITLNLGYVELSGKDFREFNLILKDVSDTLGESKLMPYAGSLVDNEGWLEDRFLQDFSQFGQCKVCHRVPIEASGQSHCWLCSQDMDIARELVFADYISVNQSHRGYYCALGYCFELTSYPPKETSEMVLSLDGTLSYYAPMMSWDLVRHVPLVEDESCCLCNECKLEAEPMVGDIVPFICLAQRASGRKYLAALKADIDRLGTLFAVGLASSQSNASISRVATMSRMIDGFFSGWIQECLKEEYPDVYSVYSGGDDLFLIGPFDQMAPMALRLYQEFRRYTTYNPDVTLSAGVSCFRPTTPVEKVARAVEQELETAKEIPGLGRDRSRDQLGFMGVSIPWEDVEFILDAADCLGRWIQSKLVARAFLYRLLSFYEMYQEYRYQDNARGLRYLPLLTYYIQRHLHSEGHAPVRDWAENLKNLDGKHIHYCGVIVKYAMLLTGGDSDDKS
jgi:CRISPR-associated protein Csm1